jgi:hypothetical protein
LFSSIFHLYTFFKMNNHIMPIQKRDFNYCILHLKHHLQRVEMARYKM